MLNTLLNKQTQVFENENTGMYIKASIANNLDKANKYNV